MSTVTLNCFPQSHHAATPKASTINAAERMGRALGAFSVNRIRIPS